MNNINRNTDLGNLEVKNCARCGQTHNVNVKAFRQGSTFGYNYWGMCSVNHEPILITFKNVQKKQKN